MESSAIEGVEVMVLLTRLLGLRLRARARSSANVLGDVPLLLMLRVMGAKYPSCFSMESDMAGVGAVILGVGGTAGCWAIRAGSRVVREKGENAGEGIKPVIWRFSKNSRGWAIQLEWRYSVLRFSNDIMAVKTELPDHGSEHVDMAIDM